MECCLITLHPNTSPRSLAEYNYFNVGIISSRFYNALTAKDEEAFKQTLLYSTIIIISTCVVTIIPYPYEVSEVQNFVIFQKKTLNFKISWYKIL